MAILNFVDISTSGVDEDALSTMTADEKIFNFASLTTTGDLAEGIFAFADNVTIRNFGSVETNGDGAGGILVIGADARIENYGSVVTKGGFLDPDGIPSGDEVFSEGIVAVGDRFHIANHGHVQVEGTFSSALVGVGMDGMVINYGRVDVISTSGAVGAVGDNSQAINRGELIAHNVDTTALFVIGEDGAVRNRGLIEMTGDGGLAMRGTFVNTEVTNAGVIRMTSDNSLAMLGVGDGHCLANTGLIETHGISAPGMAAFGGPAGTAGLDLEIHNKGGIETDGDLSVGIIMGLAPFGYFPAVEGAIANSGVIDVAGDGASGVIAVGDGNHIANSGRITTDGGIADAGLLGFLSAAGVIVSGHDALIENARKGFIRSADGASAAVEMNIIERDDLVIADTSTRLENFGKIKSADVAVLGGAGEETVINRGLIVGDVDLGGGADTFVFGKGGTVASTVFLGGGDDLVRVKNGAGDAEVADFVAGNSAGDVADVSAFFASFAELFPEAEQDGDDVKIDLDHNDRLVLKDVQLGDLNAGDFLFA